MEKKKSIKLETEKKVLLFSSRIVATNKKSIIEALEYVIRKLKSQEVDEILDVETRENLYNISLGKAVIHAGSEVGRDLTNRIPHADEDVSEQIWGSLHDTNKILMN